MNHMTLLAQKMHSERLEVVKDNEEYVNKGGEESSYEDSDEEIGGDAFEDDMGDDEEEW